uniref:Uncharacterized protein n=1 Tax=Chelonoidis abingdonii TaxID=106734 RepID=A0A8C0IPL1_CHEAB
MGLGAQQGGDPLQPQGWLSGWLPAWRPTSMSHLKNVETRILQCLQSQFVGRYVTLPSRARLWTVSLCPEQGEGRTPLVLDPRSPGGGEAWYWAGRTRPARDPGAPGRGGQYWRRPRPPRGCDQLSGEHSPLPRPKREDGVSMP